MLRLNERSVQAIAATLLLGAMAFATPAAASDPMLQLAQATPAPTPPAAPKAKAAPATTADRVESRIVALHKDLRITPDQETKWSDVARVMRDNATAIDAKQAQRAQNLKSMTAVDDLRSYRDITEAHADGLKKLIGVFETLYDSMSADQKKNADMVFARGQERPKRKASKS